MLGDCCIPFSAQACLNLGRFSFTRVGTDLNPNQFTHIFLGWVHDENRISLGSQRLRQTISLPRTFQGSDLQAYQPCPGATASCFRRSTSSLRFRLLLLCRSSGLTDESSGRPFAPSPRCRNPNPFGSRHELPLGLRQPRRQQQVPLWMPRWAKVAADSAIRQALRVPS